MEVSVLTLVVGGLCFCGANPFDRAIQCSGNEVFSSCINGGCDARNCSQLGRPVPCVKLDPRSCVRGCVCRSGLLRAASGKCVEEGECHKECNKPNEETRCVAACPPQKTCKNTDIQVSCLQEATENCKDECVCKEGYFRNAGGDCVTRDDCTKCGGQNEYYSCRFQLDRQCASLSSDTDKPASDQNSDGCTEQCYCSPGTARDENNVCVPTDQCNKPCRDAETKDYCPVACATDHCPNNEETVSCPRPAVCPPPECKCRFNFRRADNGTCIPTRDCPPIECNNPFEEYNPCPPLCPNGFCGQATPTGRCPSIFGRIGIVLECYPKCRCKNGYFWKDNKNKTCVPYDQCPGKGYTTAS